MRAWPHTIRFVTMKGITRRLGCRIPCVGQARRVGRALAERVGASGRSRRAGDGGGGVEPPLQATRSSVSAASAAALEVRITGTAQRPR